MKDIITSITTLGKKQAVLGIVALVVIMGMVTLATSSGQKIDNVNQTGTATGDNTTVDNVISF